MTWRRETVAWVVMVDGTPVAFRTKAGALAKSEGNPVYRCPFPEVKFSDMLDAVSMRLLTKGVERVDELGSGDGLHG